MLAIIEEINRWTKRYIKAMIESMQDAITNSAPESLIIPSGTAVNAVAASKVLTVSGLPTSGHTVTIGTTVYTWVDELTTDPETVPFEVLIGIDAEECIDNLVLAITAYSESEGTNFSEGTTEHEDVSAVKASSSTMTVTAKVSGVLGNSIALAENDTNTSWASSATHLTGGIDGALGSANQILADGDYIYIATDDNSISDANWKKVSIS